MYYPLQLFKGLYIISIVADYRKNWWYLIY